MHHSLGDIYKDLDMIPQAVSELEECIMIREMISPGMEGQLLRGPTHQTLATLYERLGVSKPLDMTS